MANYNWVDFDLDRAMQGSIVGFQNTVTGNMYDLSMTGKLDPDYSVMIKGVRVFVNMNGEVVKTIPETAEMMYDTDSETGQQTAKKMQMVNYTIEEAIGSNITRTRAKQEGEADKAAMSNLEARDHFAIAALKVIMGGLKQPWALDDASIISYCRQAYRWAEGMMQVGADSRGTKAAGGGGSQTEDVDLSEASTGEKLLNNIVASVDKMTKQIKERVSVAGTEDKTESVKVSEGSKHELVPLNITISAGVTGKLVKFVFSAYAYSDIYIYANLNVNTAQGTTTREAGFIIPKGSTVYYGELDSAVTEVTGFVSTPQIRGKGYDDVNQYSISTSTPSQS